VIKYIDNISRLYNTGKATEHSYRGDLQQLLNDIIDNTDIIVTNEPSRIRDVGAPDYSITKKDIPIGYIEAKDIGATDLVGQKTNKEQFDRYKDALDNLIITDYLDFLFYKNGKLIQKISIAKIQNNKIIPIEENFSLFTNNILDFTTFVSQTITSPSRLAKLMAGKARLLEVIIENAILSDVQSDENNSLRNEMNIFKTTLIHDITAASFADIYAQTIAYGLFTARLHDKTLEDFTRQEAQYLIPKSNPFLRGLFNYIGGAECDDRLIWIIDSLSEIFLATNIEKLFVDYGTKGGMEDPIIHFYETFLGEYNPKLRKSRGVWYTPASVVNFIVRACDEVLKDEFDLEDGLTDDSKIKIKVDDTDTGYTKSGILRQKEKEVHKVQILDPATGTGTFLAETIKLIKKDFWGGSWSSYVEKDLVPRLNGFELLMASYAMAHLKLDLLLMETGYKPTTEKQKRFNIFLTNSLEEYHEQTGSLFSTYLANESKEADRIKKETPVMVVMGNPPYAVSSSNKSNWIQNLIQDYKKNLNERKINLDDDYIKFIRYGQHYIEKNGEGILAYISNNSFIDGITHRQMRKSLLECFDKIYILDLHGNSKKKEVCPDGSKDENVFDIMQGVSINIFIKKKENFKKLAEVFHADLYGKRDFKYSFLNDNNLKSIKWNKLDYIEPYYFFVPKDFEAIEEYEKYFKVDKLFSERVSGVETVRDKITIHFDKGSLKKVIDDFVKLDQAEIAEKYKTTDARDWKINRAKDDILKNIDNQNVWQKISYRMFDTRETFYSGKQNGFVCNGRFNVMKHMTKENLSIILPRICKGSKGFKHGFVSKFIVDRAFGDAYSGAGTNVFPLYLYQDESSLGSTRTPNLNLEIIADIEKALNLKFTPEKIQNSKSNIQNSTFAPIDILDYIYAVLHSPKYRDRYKEFLKIDFPRVPYPSIDNFWRFVELGGKIRASHLMEDARLDDRIIDISGDGDMTITNKLNKKDTTIEADKVSLKINENISIANIPLIAWEFYIGGYQPAQKWLKDRVGRELTRSDLKHYNKIINALVRTDGLMKEIDEII